MQFSEFNFSSTLEEALSFMGFKEPTEIQEKAIPTILNGKDLIACAQTGTGKTAAFLLPLLDKLAKGEFKESAVNVLIIVPTRELALQIDQQLEAFGYFVGASSIAIYGGGGSVGWEQQKRALTEGADFVIATPGRLIAHLNMGYVKLEGVQHLVLDEADRMLDMGFFEDITTIEKYLPKERQTLMFSATMPSNIRQLAKKLLGKPEQISIAISKPAEGVLQGAYVLHDAQKLPLLEHLLTGKKNYQSILIFSSTRKNTRTIANSLQKKGFNAAFISSDLEQDERERVMRDFANRSIQVLVATDVLSRGIDIKEINLVINYDVPQDAEDYVHRIGRTARADKTGIALTLISEDDQHRFHRIEKLIEQEVRKISMPEEIGAGPEYNPKKRRSRPRFGGRGGRKSGRRGNNRGNNKRGGGNRKGGKGRKK